MHPQLADKKMACREFIQALDECHMSGWRRLTGGCNEQKDLLNSCLRKERVARTVKNNESGKVARERTKKAWQEWHADD